MSRHELARDFTRIDGTTIERGDDADRIRLVRNRPGAAMESNSYMRGGRRRDDGEQRGVDAISTGGEDGQLTALLTTVEQERPCVLEVIARALLLARIRSDRIGAPALASTRPISPAGIRTIDGP